MNSKYNLKVACLSILSIFSVSCLDLEPKAQMGDNLVWDKADNFSYLQISFMLGVVIFNYLEQIHMAMG